MSQKMSKLYNALAVAVMALALTGLVGALLFGEYATSGREFIQIPAEEPHFTISLIVVVCGFLGMAVVSFFEKRAERKLAIDCRRAARFTRRHKRERATSQFIDWQDLRNTSL